MSQLNLHMTPEFSRKLARFMKLRGIATKSEAVRTAIGEAVERAEAKPPTNWQEMRGIAAKYPHAPRKDWLTEDELWGNDGH
jgi:metal-responsive CopG/Arc/MetJ family transcriptional regulator